MRVRARQVGRPLPFIVQLIGTAEEGGEKVGFFMTVAPAYVALSAEPTPLGLRLIDELSKALGEPTLRYRDRKCKYEDYTAEWLLREELRDVRAIVERVKVHLALGYEPEELE